MFPRNAASPPRIAVGSLYQISDGALVTTGASVTVTAEGGSETAGAGTLAYLSTSGTWVYTPTQAETNYTAFIVSVYKASCTSASVSIITTASATAGRTMPADGSITAAVIATDAIDADAIKADAITEIQAGLATASAVAAIPTNPLTTLGTNAPANWINAAAIAAAALNGKGDWSTLAAGAKMDLADSLNATGVASLKTQLGTIPASGNWSTHDAAAVVTALGTGSTLTALAPASTALSTATWTPTKAGYLDAAISTRHASGAAVAKSPATLAAADVSGNLPANVVQWNTSTLPTIGTSTLDQTGVQAAMTSQGYTITRAGYLDTLNGLVAAIWAALTSSMTAAGSIGKKLADWIVGKVLSYDTGTAPLQPAVSGRTLAVGADGSVTAAVTITAEQIAGIADAVWDEAMSGHVTAGTAGVYLVSSGSAADPWLALLPGTYTTGQAGYIIGVNLAAIKAKTDLLAANSVPNVISPVRVASRSITIDRGRDYTDDISAAIEIPYIVQDLTGATVQLVARDATTDAVTLTVACSVTDPGGTGQTVVCQPTAAQTALMASGVNAHVFECWAVLAGGKKVSILKGGASVPGGITVVEWQGRD